jgi:hypothetical protein
MIIATAFIDELSLPFTYLSPAVTPKQSLYFNVLREPLGRNRAQNVTGQNPRKPFTYKDCGGAVHPSLDARLPLSVTLTSYRLPAYG